MRGHIALVGVFVLSSCGVPTDPEKGPVALLCEGDEVIHAPNGEVVREPKREFYRLDGVAKTFEVWNDEDQSFVVQGRELHVSPTEMTHSFISAMRDLSIIRYVSFDRISGRVSDESQHSNGGTITFTATCLPVKEPISERKF